MRARRSMLALATMSVLSAGLVSASPALAAEALETPTIKAATGVTATAATLNGELNPGAGTAESEYHFLYTPGTSATACEGTAAPETAGTSVGNHQAVTQEVTGLEPNAEYAFCLQTFHDSEILSSSVATFKTPPAAPTVSEESVSEVTPTGLVVSGQVNPNNEETTYAAKCGTGEDPIDATQAYPGGVLPTGFGNNPVTVTVTGLTPNTKYSCWLVATNHTGETQGATELILQTEDQPVVTTGASSNLTRTTVALAGTVYPAGALTTYHFVYGTTESYGSSTSPVSAGESFEDVAASAALEELKPGTTYHYALVATNVYGTVTGVDQTFTTSPPTPPTASTDGTVNVGHQTAILTGTIEPDGLPTIYEFQLGTEAGVYYPQTFGSASGTGQQPVALELQALTPGATYHYRVVATNQDGTSYGQDQTFTTESYPNPLTVPVSPALLPVAPATVTPTTKVAAKKPAKKPVKHKKSKSKKKKKRKKK